MSKVRDERKRAKKANEAVQKESGFSSPYDFFDLSDEECAKKIGKPFRTNMSSLVYVPVATSGFNYGRPTGLVGFDSLRGFFSSRTGETSHNFYVFVASPDDLDITLNFYGVTPEFRNQVIEYVCELAPMGFTYCDLFTEIQSKFKVGTFYY